MEASQVSQKISNKEFAAMVRNIISYRQYQASGNFNQAVKELRQALGRIEKRMGTHHYLYVALQRELAYLYFNSGRHEDAEKAYLDLEANYRQTISGDGPGLANIYYDTARSIERGTLARVLQANNLAERQKQAARVEHYARAAYRQGKQSGIEEHRLGVYGTYLAHTLLFLRPQPDNAAAEEVAREAVRIRNEFHGVGHELTSHPLSYLLLALARQNKVDEIEKVVLDLLARNPQPKWSAHSADALPEAARTLARAGKTKTALLVLEQVIVAGYYGIDQLRADPVFAPLRESEEYRQLLKKLAK
jgi:hypothetical protein